MLIQTEINEIDNILNVNKNDLIIAFSKSDEERKTFLIIIGVTILGLACYEIYFYFKNKK